MMPCDHCQNELLPYVFDLLDQADRERLEQHLEGCDSCRSALVRVRGQQELLRRASRAKFPGVSFHAPTVVPAPSSEPVKSEARNHWRLLALAASVLIMFILGGPAAWWTARFAQIRYQLAIVQKQEAAAQQTQLFRTRQRLNDELKEAMKPDRLAIDFFPEGGALIAGVPNRVYFQVRNKQGDSVDFRGHLIDDGEETVVADVRTLNTVVADVRTLNVDDKNLGLGKFTFTPKERRTYSLVKDGQEEAEEYRLPYSQSDGVGLSLARDSFKAGEPVSVTLYSVYAERKLKVAATAQGQVLDEKTLAPETGKPATVALHTNTAGGCVCRLTVSEVDEDQGGKLEPVAERLFYVQPTDELHLAFNPQVAGDKATLQIESKGGNGQPSATVVSLSVVDASQGQFGEGHLALKERALGRNSKGLEDAVVLLDPDPKAAAALDLQLGANNWRDPQQSSNTLVALRGEEAAVRYQLELLDAGTHPSLTRPLGSRSRQLEERLANLQSIANPMRPFAIIGLAIVALLLFSAFLWPIVRARWPRVGVALAGILAAAAILMATFWNPGENLEKPKRPAIALTTPAPVNSTKKEPTNAPAPIEEKLPGEPLERAGAKSSIAPIAPAPAQVETLRRSAPRSAAPEGVRPGGLGGGGIGGGLGGGSGGRGFGGAPMIADTKKKEAAEKEQIGKEKGANIDRGLAAPAPAGMAGLSLERAKKSAAPETKPSKPAAPVSESELRDSAASGKRELPAHSSGLDAKSSLQKNAPDAKADSNGLDFSFRLAPKAAADARVLYWNPSLSLPDGKAEIPLDLPRSVSYIKITAEVRTPDGRVGTATRTIAIPQAGKR
jgi:hypothetical protein